MFSTRFIRRLTQATLVLVLGLWVHAAEGRTCTECNTCSQYTCPSRVCADCPRGWVGSCYAGTEGCTAYTNCTDEGFDCCGSSVCQNQCYCPACPG